MKAGKGLSGWLSPSGVFYPCGHQEHYKLASEIIFANEELNRNRVQINFEKGTVVSYDDVLKFMDWIVMGCLEYAPHHDYVFFPNTREFRRTQEQIDWFETHHMFLSEKQIEMLDNHIDRILRLERLI